MFINCVCVSALLQFDNNCCVTLIPHPSSSNIAKRNIECTKSKTKIGKNLRFSITKRKESFATASYFSFIKFLRAIFRLDFNFIPHLMLLPLEHWAPNHLFFFSLALYYLQTIYVWKCHTLLLSFHYSLYHSISIAFSDFPVQHHSYTHITYVQRSMIMETN